MSEDFKVKLEAGRDRLIEKSHALNEQLSSLIEQRAQIDRQMQAIKEEHLKIEGEYRAVLGLLGESGNEKPKLETPKKKKAETKKKEGKGS